MDEARRIATKHRQATKRGCREGADAFCSLAMTYRDIPVEAKALEGLMTRAARSFQRSRGIGNS
jgi:hypothetical protein